MSKAIAFGVAVLFLSFGLDADCLLRGVQYLENGSEQSDMTVADFNGDGSPDVVLSGTEAGLVRIFLNQGDGSFAISSEKRMKPMPVLIKSADFNGDSHMDLAVVTTNSIVILNNDGKAKFLAAQYIRAQKTIAVVAADMNSDSVADLAVLRRIGSEAVINVYHNARSEFHLVQTLAVKSASDLIAARLGSGRTLDLVAAGDRGTITVFKGTGTGRFQQMASAQAAPGAAHLAAGFVNGDAQMDLVVTGANGEVAVMLGQKESEFRRLQISTGSDIQGLAVADFNADHRTDLLLVNRNSRASIYSGNGQGNFKFTRSFAYGLFTGPVLAADLNRDGSDDLVAAERGATGIYLRNGNNSFAIGARTVLNHGGNLFAGDFDADGNPDLVISGANGSLLLKGKGDGSFFPAQKTALPQIGYAAVADLNGDGKADLAGFDRFRLKAWLSTGESQFKLTASLQLSVDPPVQSLDVNGDRVQDLEVMTPNALIIFLGGGDGNFTRLQPIRFDYQERGTLADLNGDGMLDLVTLNQGKEKHLTTYLGGPNLSFTKQMEIPLNGCPAAISSGDANGDGKADLVVGSTCESKVTLLLGDGNGGISAARIVPAGSASVNPHFVDFNSDGKAEILSVAQNLAKPSITLAPDFADYRLLGPFYWTYVAVADFDHDGSLDLAASSYNSTAIFLNCH